MKPAMNGTAMKRLLYLVSEDWYFLSHRLPMARAAREAGYEVHVGTRIATGRAAIEAEGFIVHDLAWRRGSTNPLDFLRAVAEVRALYRRIRPDLVHQVALWPTIVGGMAALGLPFPRLSALAGLGFSFTSNTVRARLLRGIFRGLLRVLLDRERCAVLVQNADDRAVMENIGIAARRIVVIPGSGVDTVSLQPLPEPPEPVTVGYAGRLLDDKGLRPLIAAQAQLMRDGHRIHLLIAGDIDPVNPSSIPEAEVNGWTRHDGVTVLGHVADIRALWSRAHIAALASRREGLPKSLLEAAACGRPIVATDVPGCREIARDGVNAVLVPPDNAAALADAILRLARDPALRARFGTASRDLAEREFSEQRIGREIVSLYRNLR